MVIYGDQNFNTLTGQRISRKTIVQFMIDFFNDKYPNTNITDFNDGSEIRDILEGIAVAIYHLELQTTEAQRISFISTSYGSWLDLHGEDWDTPRNLGTNSYGMVTFSIPEPVDYNIVIPYGTVLVANDTGAEFVIIQDAEIKIGTTSIDANAISYLYGDFVNAPANTITIFKDEKPSALLSVTNNNGFTGGTDREDDEDYRKRILKVKGEDSFGSKEYYTRLATDIDGVHDIKITTSSNNKTAKIIVNGDDKPLSDDVLALVVQEFTDEKKIVYNHTFDIEKTEYTTLNLEFEVSVVEELSETLFTDILKALLNGGGYLDTVYYGLNIDQTLIKYELLNCIESLIGVVQVTDITRDGQDFDNKLTPSANTVFKLGTVDITQNVIED